MSLENYNKAKNILIEKERNLHAIGPCTLELVDKAADVLNLKFPSDYKQFLLDFGAISFLALEVCGIVDDDFFNSSVPDAIWYTLSERKTGMPNNLLVIHEVGNGELFVLNYSKLNENNEPKVTSYLPGFNLEVQTFEVIANDFGDFLLEQVKFEIEKQ